MGFVTGSCCFLQSPFCHSIFFSTPSSSSQSSFHPPFSLSSLRNVPSQRKKIKAMARLHQEDSKNSDSCARRAILFMGFAVFPLLRTRAEAVEGLVAENTELTAQGQQQKAKQSVQGSTSQNLFFSLLNALGFLGSGVLAALYASTQKEKAISDATIESMNIILKEKKAAITSLEKKYEAELLNEKDVRNKAFAKANEEKQSLVNQLKLANDTITSLGKELQKEKRLAEELTIKVDSLEVGLSEAGDGKRELQKQLKEKIDSLVALQERIDLLSSQIEEKEENLRHLNAKLADKERESNQLSSLYQQSENQVTTLNSEMKELKDLILKSEKELGLKNQTVDKLNTELTSSFAEKNEIRKKLDDVLNEYNQFKSSAEMKSASDAKLLGEREEKIHLLEEQLKFSLDEVNKNKGLVSDLAQERGDLKEMLNIELKNVKNLEKELRITQDALKKSRDEASDLAKELQQSRSLCSELEDEITKIRAEFSEAKESLKRNIDQEKQNVGVKNDELKSANDLLSKLNKELQTKSQEVENAVQKCDSLEKKIVDAYAKAESTNIDLKEEKNITSSLNKELRALETQIPKEKEARKRLESDLEEASKSLDEMNRKALILSKDLEIANSRILSLEDERDGLYQSRNEQKRASQEARENLEDAHNLVMRLGKERESLEKRGKKLVEEVASAKGEILRLRSEINSGKTAVNNDQPKEKVEKAGVTTRKVTRRRKVNNSPKEES